jgi:hypothetical protein
VVGWAIWWVVVAGYFRSLLICCEVMLSRARAPG